jgi:hypothetical protein
MIMSRSFCLQLLVLLSLSLVTSAQVLDTSVCDVLNNPVAFDGKLIRVKATAVAGFDEFVIQGSGCSSDGAIWLDYPSGTKGKAGPAALMRLQLAKNAAAVTDVPERGPVTLQRDSQFSRFDSLLATPAKSRAMCLGCPRYTVSATIVGRLDAVDAPGLIRDDKGKVTGLSGFGNMNLYRARLVLQSVSDVANHDIDYAATTMAGDSKRAQSHVTAEQLNRAMAAYGAEGEDNGVSVGFGVANEVVPNEFAKGAADSPDGVLFHTTFNMDRVSKNDLSAAMAHIGTHIADIREGIAAKGLADFEDRAWRATFK